MRKSRAWTIGVAAALVAAGPLLSGFGRGSWNADSPRSTRWSAEEAAVLASLQLSRLPSTPSDPSNRVEGRAEAAALGKRLFNDARFSRNGAVSCASCHDPEQQFQDGRPVGQGMGIGSRRAMPVAGAGYGGWFFWDGRKDSLWSQALGPLEDAVEHGGNRTRYVRLLRDNYRSEYETLFGRMPDLRGLPDDAGPLGTPAEQAAWAALTPERRDDVSRVYANLGKVIAAYEKTLTFGISRFDRYVEGLLAKAPGAESLLTEQEVNGLRLFIGKGQCVTCHNGPLLTDQHFHNTGVPPRDPSHPDRGRALAVSQVQKDEFNCLGPFSDAKADACQELRFIVTEDPSLEAAFKTPGLRNVALRPPYMHAGQFATLEEVIAHYLKAPRAAIGHSELSNGDGGHAERARIRLSAQEAKDVAAFLGTLSGPIVEGADRINRNACSLPCTQATISERDAAATTVFRLPEDDSCGSRRCRQRGRS
jgi:cytochrome c peroxidase